MNLDKLSLEMIIGMIAAIAGGALILRAFSLPRSFFENQRLREEMRRRRLGAPTPPEYERD